MNEEYNIRSLYSNRVIGKWRVYNGTVQFKEVGKYEFLDCIDITETKFYDEFEAKQSKIKHVFYDKYYVYQCQGHQALLLFSKTDHEDKKVAKYSPNVSSYDLSEVMTNIGFGQRSF